VTGPTEPEPGRGVTTIVDTDKGVSVLDVLMPSIPAAYRQVVSRTFASFRVPKSGIFPAQDDFWGGFDSRQLHL
jgi:hypothetical protein